MEPAWRHALLYGAPSAAVKLGWTSGAAGFFRPAPPASSLGGFEVCGDLKRDRYENRGKRSRVGDQELRNVRQHQADAVTRLDASRTKAASHLVGEGLHLSVGDLKSSRMTAALAGFSRADSRSIIARFKLMSRCSS